MNCQGKFFYSVRFTPASATAKESIISEQRRI